MHTPEANDKDEHNPFATRLLQQGKVETPNHHAITVQQVVGSWAEPHVPYKRLTMRAYGTAYVIYERLIEGKWCVTKPSDQWHTIRDKVK